MPERAFFMPMEQIKELIRIERNKKILFKKMQEAFDIYEKFENLDYLFVADDGCCYPARFYQRDFVHLTGIKILGDESRFYISLKKGTASYNDLDTNQKYSNNNINKKLRLLTDLDAFINNRIDGENIVIEDFESLTTGKGFFNYSLRSDSKRYTLVFGKHNNARSARFELASSGFNRKKIICIFVKDRESKEYQRISYLDKNYSIADILKKIPLPYHLSKNGGLLQE